MKKGTHIFFAGLLALSAASCGSDAATELSMQEQITLDHAAVQMQLDSISAVLYGGDPLDMDSPEYAALVKADDSLQTLLFDRYPADSLRAWAESHRDLLGRQYESFMIEIEAREESDCINYYR